MGDPVMKVLSLILLLLIANAMAQSQAQSSDTSASAPLSCPSVRLDRGENSMVHVAVRDQGSVPNCFAHVAAEIIDAWRFSHGDTNYAFQTSGLNLSFDYWGQDSSDKPFTGYNDPKFNSGGNTSQALDVAAKDGVCNKATTIEALSQSDIKDLFETVQNTIEKEQKENALPANKQTPLAQDKTAQNFGKYIDKFDDSAAKSLHENEAAAPLPQASNLVSAIRDPNADSDISEILGKACDSKSRLQVSYPKNDNPAAFIRPESTVINTIRTALSHPNPQPVAISLCAQVLYESKNFRGRTGNSISSDCEAAGHAVIAIGSRPSGKSCQYLIRSSWGQSCSGFGAGWSCDQNSGAVWVDEDALVGNTISLAYFDDQVPPNLVNEGTISEKSQLKPSAQSTDASSRDLASEAPKDLELKVEKKLIKFYRTFEGHLMLSKGCTLASSENCQAAKALRSISFASLKDKIKGDVNPGAVFCNEIGGKEQLGVDKNQNENMLCRFSDDSRVACSSLLYFAQLNDYQSQSKKGP